MAFKMGSMFSGIGGLDLGLEWGIKDAETVWQIEMEPFGRSILERHWPDADRSVTDVREGNAENLAPVNLISGGFPCQDISVAGNQKGFDGEKSSLWFEMARIIGELRPRFIVLENVAAITSIQGVHSRVLSDVASMGYNGEWHRVGACDVGAPHRRWRWFFIGWLPNVADTQSTRRERSDPVSVIIPKSKPRSTGDGQPMADTNSARRQNGNTAAVPMEQEQPGTAGDGQPMADTNSDTTTMRGECQDLPRQGDSGRKDRSGSGGNAKREKPLHSAGIDPVDELADTMRQRRQGQGQHDEPQRAAPREDRKAGEFIPSTDNPWRVEPPLGRVVNGLSPELARRNRHALKALGNAVVPAVAELVGRRVQQIREILDNE